MSRALRLVFAGLLAAAPAAAQGQFLLDLSGGSTRHQFTAEGTALSVAPRFLWRSSAARLDAGLTYTRGASFRWNAEGGLDGSLSQRLGKGFSTTLAASGWWTVHPVGQGTGQLSLLPALNLSRRTFDLSMEGGAGHASTVSGGRWFGLLGLRGHWYVGPVDLQGEVRQTRFTEQTVRWSNYWGPPASRPDTLPGAIADTLASIRGYNDLGLTVGWILAQTRFSLGIEQRLGERQFQATAWHAEATHALGSEMALFASAGRTLSALTAGLPARRYAALGIRWAPGARHIRFAPARETDGRGVRLVREAGSESSGVMLKAAGASSVEVKGDFSDWEPVVLSGAGSGWWLLPMKLAPGLYRLNVRYDGGRWETPSGLPSEADEFNGRVAVLLIVP